MDPSHISPEYLNREELSIPKIKVLFLEEAFSKVIVAILSSLNIEIEEEVCVPLFKFVVERLDIPLYKSAAFHLSRTNQIEFQNQVLDGENNLLKFGMLKGNITPFLNTFLSIISPKISEQRISIESLGRCFLNSPPLTIEDPKTLINICKRLSRKTKGIPASIMLWGGVLKHSIESKSELSEFLQLLLKSIKFKSSRNSAFECFSFFSKTLEPDNEFPTLFFSSISKNKLSETSLLHLSNSIIPFDSNLVISEIIIPLIKANNPVLAFYLIKKVNDLGDLVNDLEESIKSILIRINSYPFYSESSQDQLVTKALIDIVPDILPLPQKIIPLICISTASSNLKLSKSSFQAIQRIMYKEPEYRSLVVYEFARFISEIPYKYSSFIMMSLVRFQKILNLWDEPLIDSEYRIPSEEFIFSIEKVEGMILPFLLFEDYNVRKNAYKSLELLSQISIDTDLSVRIVDLITDCSQIELDDDIIPPIAIFKKKYLEGTRLETEEISIMEILKDEERTLSLMAELGRKVAYDAPTTAATAHQSSVQMIDTYPIRAAIFAASSADPNVVPSSSLSVLFDRLVKELKKNSEYTEVLSNAHPSSFHLFAPELNNLSISSLKLSQVKRNRLLSQIAYIYRVHLERIEFIDEESQGQILRHLATLYSFLRDFDKGLFLLGLRYNFILSVLMLSNKSEIAPRLKKQFFALLSRYIGIGREGKLKKRSDIAHFDEWSKSIPQRRLARKILLNQVRTIEFAANLTNAQIITEVPIEWITYLGKSWPEIADIAVENSFKESLIEEFMEYAREGKPGFGAVILKNLVLGECDLPFPLLIEFVIYNIGSNDLKVRQLAIQLFRQRSITLLPQEDEIKIENTTLLDKARRMQLDLSEMMSEIHQIYSKDVVLAFSKRYHALDKGKEIVIDLVCPWLKKIKSIDLGEIIPAVFKMSMNELGALNLWFSLNHHRQIASFAVSSITGFPQISVVEAAKRIVLSLPHDALSKLLQLEYLQYFPKKQDKQLKTLKEEEESNEDMSLDEIHRLDAVVILLAEIEAPITIVPILLHLAFLSIDHRLELVRKHSIHLLQSLAAQYGDDISVDIENFNKNNNGDISHLSRVLDRCLMIFPKVKEAWSDEAFRWMISKEGYSNDRHVAICARSANLYSELIEQQYESHISQIIWILQKHLTLFYKHQPQFMWVIIPLLKSLQVLSEFGQSTELFWTGIALLNSAEDSIISIALDLIKKYSSVTEELLESQPQGFKFVSLQTVLSRALENPITYNSAVQIFANLEIEDDRGIVIGLSALLPYVLSHPTESHLLKKLQVECLKQFPEIGKVLERIDEFSSPKELIISLREPFQSLFQSSHKTMFFNALIEGIKMNPETNILIIKHLFKGEEVFGSKFLRLDSLQNVISENPELISIIKQFFSDTEVLEKPLMIHFTKRKEPTYADFGISSLLKGLSGFPLIVNEPKPLETKRIISGQIDMSPVFRESGGRESPHSRRKTPLKSESPIPVLVNTKSSSESEELPEISINLDGIGGDRVITDHRAKYNTLKERDDLAKILEQINAENSEQDPENDSRIDPEIREMDSIVEIELEEWENREPDQLMIRAISVLRALIPLYYRLIEKNGEIIDLPEKLYNPLIKQFHKERSFQKRLKKIYDLNKATSISEDLTDFIEQYIESQIKFRQNPSKILGESMQKQLIYVIIKFLELKSLQDSRRAGKWKKKIKELL